MWHKGGLAYLALPHVQVRPEASYLPAKRNPYRHDICTILGSNFLAMACVVYLLFVTRATYRAVVITCGPRARPVASLMCICTNRIKRITDLQLPTPCQHPASASHRAPRRRVLAAKMGDMHTGIAACGCRRRCLEDMLTKQKKLKACLWHLLFLRRQRGVSARLALARPTHRRHYSCQLHLPRSMSLDIPR